MSQRAWLMKTEPESFSIDDLARVKIEPWSGVRNYMARAFMRDQMQVGDDVLFYHSSTTPPGVVGLARVHRTGVVDETQFDPASQYHDPGADRADPRWICVDVEFIEKLPRMVTLDELRVTEGLEDMLVLRKGQRLSVQPVTPPEFAIVAQLGYQPAKALPAKAPKPAAKKPAAKKPAARKPAKQPAAKKPAAKKPAAKKPAPKPSTKPRAATKAGQRGGQRRK